MFTPLEDEWGDIELMFEVVEGPVHFIGIGGAGMSGLAELAIKRGLSVQGSDLKPSHMTARLANLGAKIHFGHHEDAAKDARTIVYSSAISSDNVELIAAAASGARCMHRSDFLAWLMQRKKALTVAGTHGKSTTSAMILHVLDALGEDPTAAIGGNIRAYQSTARHGERDLFIAEADESDGSFLKYSPYIAVITNIDLDHMEYYKTESRLLSAFDAYLKRITDEGVAIIGWDNPLSRQVGSAFEGQRLTYGLLLGSEVRAVNVHWDGQFTVFKAIVERDQVPVKLNAMGIHNVQNALCALAVTRALDLDIEVAARSLSSFAGVDRRMTLIFDRDEIKIYDDYAHNPGKIQACIKALKEAFPKHALFVVYQPHRYSRLETMYDAMLSSLRQADYLFVVPVYTAGEQTSQDFSPERLVRDLVSRYQMNAFPCQDLEDAAQRVAASSVKPSVILTVGAGDVHIVASQLRDVFSEPK